MINDYKSLIVKKGGYPIIVPLSAYAAQLFKSEYSQLKEYEKKYYLLSKRSSPAIIMIWRIMIDY